MDPTVKKIIAIAASLALTVVGYYGSYLPLRKSQLYVRASQEAQGVNTLMEFTEKMDMALNAPSPIGQSELVRNVGSMALTIIRSAGDNPQLVDATVNYLMGHYNSIIKKGHGLSFEQDVYILGIIHEAAYVQTKNPAYLEASERYYLMGHDLGPKRPQFLYGLFDIYRLKNDSVKLEQVANQILTLWPEDTSIRNALQAFRERSGTSVPKPTR